MYWPQPKEQHKNLNIHVVVHVGPHIHVFFQVYIKVSKSIYNGLEKVP